MKSRCFVVALLFAMLLAFTGRGSAHPLGNFSISQYSALRVAGNEVELRYLIDMAEIPTFQEIQENGFAPQAEDPRVETYLTRKSELLRKGLTLEVNGQSLPLRVESKEIIFPTGAGGLPTLKIGISYKAKLIRDSKSPAHLLIYRDGNFPGRAGWKEIIAVGGPGARILNSSVPETDLSSQLNDYPTDLLNTPPQELEASVAFSTAVAPVSVASTASSRTDSATREKARPIKKVQISRAQVSQSSSEVKPEKQSGDTQIVSPTIDDTVSTAADDNAALLQANRQATPRDSFTELIATETLGLGVILIALAVAVGLGAFHALEPGHGKTLVAAYLVGSRGTVQHAFLLGLIVTATHTAGVYLLGAITLYASQYIVPERLYPWLAVASGVLIAGLGGVLLFRCYRGETAISSHHHHHHAKHSHGHHHRQSHDHSHTHFHHDLNERVSLRELLTLGISGGIVPCPAALVVLLSAVSIQRIGFGLLLIVAFSIGLATVLITIGLLMVSARQLMSQFQASDSLTTRWLPLTSSVFILVFGVALTLQALRTAGMLFV